MKTNLIPAIRLTIVCAIFFCVCYPFLIWAVAQMSASKGKGDFSIVNGKKHYNTVGQTFTKDTYFWSRPSAVDYDAAGSGGSNLGPANQEHLAEVKARVDTFLMRNPGIKRADVPADLVTASGSGLDPDISVQAANIQIKRVATARNMTVESLEELVRKHTEKPLLGMFGPSHVNVVKLNLALDQLK